MKINALFMLMAALGGIAPDTQTSSNAPLNQEFKIKVGQQVTIKKIGIKFSAVNNESRCPTGVQCIWAGNAAVAIEFSKKGKKAMPATLNTSVQPTEMNFKGYKIKLVALSPHPKVNQTIDERDYEATLIVTKD